MSPIRRLSPVVVVILTAVLFSTSACSSGSTPNSNPILNAAPARQIAGDQTLGASNLAASQLTTSGPYHITTWANDEFWAQGSQASAAQVAQLVSYAESGLGNAKAMNDCKAYPGTCKSVYYFDPNLAYVNPQCPFIPSQYVVNAASESWYIHMAGHTDTAHRVLDYYNQTCHGRVVPIPVYRMNDANTGVQGWWRSELQTNADGFDVFFMDDTHANVINQYFACPLPSYCYSTQEVANDAAVVAAHSSFVNSINHKNGQAMQFAFNSLNFNGQQVSPGLALFRGSSRFMAAVCEGCAVSNGRFMVTNYPRILNTMAATNAIPGAAFVLHSTDSAPSGSSIEIQERTLSAALVWLGYSSGHTIAWPDLEDSSKNLAVWPEDLVYPSSPVESMSSGATDLQVSPGVWRREFTTCYQAGVYFGRCAAIVNGSTSYWRIPSSWLRQSYGHVITVAGGDVLAGGVAYRTAAFVPGQTAVPAYQAILLAQ